MLGYTSDKITVVDLPSGEQREIKCCPICREPANYSNDHVITCSNQDCDLHSSWYPTFLNKKIWNLLSSMMKRNVYYDIGKLHKDHKLWNKISDATKDHDSYIPKLKGINI